MTNNETNEMPETSEELAEMWAERLAILLPLLPADKLAALQGTDDDD